MVISGKRWAVTDKYGNLIYLSEKQWKHIIEETNHPEMEIYEEHMKTTIKQGRRRQEPLNPRKYRYYYQFNDLPDDNNHIVVIVLFGFDFDDCGLTVPNNFIATAFFKHIKLKA